MRKTIKRTRTVTAEWITRYHARMEEGRLRVVQALQDRMGREPDAHRVAALLGAMEEGGGGHVVRYNRTHLSVDVSTGPGKVFEVYLVNGNVTAKKE